MKKFINVAVFPETREKIRVIAKKTNAKKAQIIDDAISASLQKILSKSINVDNQ